MGRSKRQAVPPVCRLAAALTAAVALAGLAGCKKMSEPPPSPPFSVIVKVTSDPGHPLAGAMLMKGGLAGPSTGQDGTVQVNITGIEGESVDLTVKCPVGFVSPAHPVSVLLRRNGGGKLAEYAADCPPDTRHMVVAVRADNGANLPVKVYDRVVGYTDQSGSFTYAVSGHPGDTMMLSLDTTQAPRLSPKNPETPVTIQPKDEIVAYDPKFTLAPPPKKVVIGPWIPRKIEKHPSGPHHGLY